MMEHDDWAVRYSASLMHTFGMPKRLLVRGEGARVWDEQGRCYLDLLAGIAVNVLGHAHKDVVAAITTQLKTLGHVSNFFTTPQQIALAERLAALALAESSGISARVFFANSGAEANEAALKITRLSGRRKVVAMEGSFHGRTMGALSLTYSEQYRAPFAPLLDEVIFVPFGSLDALAAVMDDTVAAVVVETIQGENGVIEAPEGYLAQIREMTKRHGTLLWIDEVQTGMGRCGEWFAHSTHRVMPDIITVAKGLANGFPIGACIAVGEAAEAFTPGSHGTTFGGNPVAAAAALAVIDVIERDDLLAHARELGDWFAQAIVSSGHIMIDNVTGRGLLRGIRLTRPIAPQVSDALLEHGFIVNAPRPHILRLAPPLVVQQSELQSFLDVLGEVLDREGEI